MKIQISDYNFNLHHTSAILSKSILVLRNQHAKIHFPHMDAIFQKP